jgi:predicted transglutaminase-like cysteine proteinase
MAGLLKKVFVGAALLTATSTGLRAAEKQGPVLFGTSTTDAFNEATNDRSDVAEWYAMEGRQASLLNDPENAEIWNKWLSQFDYLKDAPLEDKARAVDFAVDRDIAYTDDRVSSRVTDYWSSPIEALKKGMGDCEDIATVKYHALRYLGVPANKMYVAVVEDKKDLHVVLTLDARADGAEKPRIVVLEDEGDNRNGWGKLMEEKDDRYPLLHAMNENGVWRAVRPKSAKRAQARPKRF